MANAENTGPELVEIAQDHKDKAVKMPSVATVAEVAVKNENGEWKANRFDKRPSKF